MSDTYTKLFSSITESTVWGEPYSTRIVWVAMLAMADAKGHVYGSVPGLARRANVTLGECEAALAAFLAPDPYSRTRDEDGRRIEEIDGGWRLINHGKYSAVRDAEERREYQRKWDREHRPSGHKRTKQSDQSDNSPTNNDKNDQPDPTSTNTNTKELEAPTGALPTSAVADCPHEAIIALYHEALPSLRQVLTWEGERPKLLRTRWREAPERRDLGWWREFFGYVAASDFLMGRTTGRDGRSFDCDLEWLIRPKNFAKVIEGKYENGGRP